MALKQFDPDETEQERIDRVGYSGPLWDRYQIYLSNTADSSPKTFDEWLED